MPSKLNPSNAIRMKPISTLSCGPLQEIGAVRIKTSGPDIVVSVAPLPQDAGRELDLVHLSALHLRGRSPPRRAPTIPQSAWPHVATPLIASSGRCDGFSLAFQCSRRRGGRSTGSILACPLRRSCMGPQRTIFWVFGYLAACNQYGNHNNYVSDGFFDFRTHKTVIAPRFKLNSTN